MKRRRLSLSFTDSDLAELDALRSHVVTMLIRQEHKDNRDRISRLDEGAAPSAE